MPFYMRLGSIPSKRHIAHKREGGYRGEGIYYEEVVTTAGFGRAYSIVYHLRPPTRVKKVEAAGTVTLETVSEPALRHHHFKTGAIKPAGDPLTGRITVANAKKLPKLIAPATSVDAPQLTVQVSDGTLVDTAAVTVTLNAAPQAMAPIAAAKVGNG